LDLSVAAIAFLLSYGSHYQAKNQLLANRQLDHSGNGFDLIIDALFDERLYPLFNYFTEATYSLMCGLLAAGK
jgi:hypothetical protein